MKNNDVFTKYLYELYGEDGEGYSQEGEWLKCDGGYHNWVMMICSFKHSTNLLEIDWSGGSVSVRKDVEVLNATHQTVAD